MQTSLNQLIFKVLFLTIMSIVLTNTSRANEKIEGCFVAKKECEALHSIRKHTNPGNVRLEPFKLYSITAGNKPNPTYYQVKTDAENPRNRWVPISCGNYVANCRLLPSTTATNTQNKTQYLLALSWEPAFCETHPQKIECKTLTPDRQDAKQLSLHGLWPQPRNNAYCNVDSTTKAIDRRKKWGLLKQLDLSDETRNRLAISMPGYASNLQRHEWIKHGTCYGLPAEIYYRHSIQLTEAVNQSEVGSLLANNIGKKISAEAIRNAFDQSFGVGAGSKVNVRCDKKGRLSELWINLSGAITDPSDLRSLLKHAESTRNSCKFSLIDPVD
ncbi:MAG: ribonuclease T2 [Thiotrichaceae bacterium]